MTIYESFGFHHSYGKTICSTCRHLVSTHSNANSIAKHESIFKWALNCEISDDEYEDDSTSDLYEYPMMHSSPESVDCNSAIELHKEKRSVLNQFLRLCGSQKVVRTTHNYNDLKSQSKANFLTSARHLFQHIIQFLVTENSSDFADELFSSNDGNYYQFFS